MNGRNAISWRRNYTLIWYVENRTIWVDLKILLKTVIKVFKREGIAAAGEETAAKFKGE